eukprot:274385-Amphidinium_carterae.1
MALRSERVTFRAKFVTGVRRVISEKLLTGYLNHFGEDRIKCVHRVKHVQVGSGASQTIVLSCKSREAVCSPQQWETLLNCKDSKSFLAELAAHVPMKALDAFKVTCKEGEFYAMIRVPEVDINRWLDCDFPMAVSPIGDELSKYKVHWDADLTYIDDIRDRYLDCPGWAGLVLGRDSIGCRLHAAQHSLAMSFLGQPTGSIYVVSGVPLEASRDEVIEFLEQIEWTCELLAFRKVQYRSAVYRVRSDVAPPHDSCLACFGYVRAQVRIQPQSGTKTREQVPVQQAGPPLTWSEAAKRTLGPQPLSVVEAPKPPPQREQTADDWGPDDDDEDEDQDCEMVDDDEEHGSEHSWQPFDLFEDEDGRPEAGADEREPRSTPLAAKPKSEPSPVRPHRESTRLDVLEQRMASMSEMLATFISMQTQGSGGASQVLATPVHTARRRDADTGDKVSPLTAPVRKRDWEEALRPKTARATTALTVELESCFEWKEVPKDGACAWHALGILVDDKYEEPYHAVQGFHFKSRVIKQIRESATEAADVLGVSKPDLLAFLKELTPSTVWADARALLLIAYVHAVNIMVVNETDGTLEILSPFGDQVPDTVCWPVRFAHSHFSPGKIVNWPCVAQATKDLAFAPWNPRRHLTGGGSDCVVVDVAAVDSCGVCVETEDMAGEAISGIDDASTCDAESNPASELDCELCSEWDEDCDHEFACIDPDVSLPVHEEVITSLNIGSWRARGHHVLALALQKRTIFFLQETKLSADGQAAAAKQCGDIEYECLFGAPTVPLVTANGKIRQNGGECPGVGFVYPKGTPLYSVPCTTVNGKKLEQAGRLKLAVLETSTGRVVLVNLYCHSGPSQQAERTNMQKQIAEEIARFNMHATIIGGDFNETPVHSSLMGMLCDSGWRAPSVHTRPPVVTYDSGGVRSWLDGFLLSPQIDPNVQYMWTQEVPGLQHRAVHLPWSIPTACRYPRFRRPCDVAKGPPMHQHSPVDWPSLNDEFQVTLQTLESRSLWEDQSLVDECWGVFASHLLQHLRACHEVPDTKSSAGELGVTYLSWCPKPRKVQSIEPHSPDTVKVYRALHRLFALASGKETAECKRKLAAQKDLVCNELKLTHAEFEASLTRPQEWTSTWQHAVHKRDQRLKDAAVGEWKRRLENAHHSPTPALYRWLRGRKPAPSLIMCKGDEWKTGPEAYFGAMIEHWANIHNDAPTGREELNEWLVATPMPHLGDDYVEDPACLRRSVQAMKAKSAAGLDGWTVAAIRLMPSEALSVLLKLFRIIEQLCTWPSQWRLVRVVMIPKESDARADPGSLRPISVLSVFVRLWARYRLHMLPDHAKNAFPVELTGGLQGRSAFGGLLCMLARMEAHLVNVDFGDVDMLEDPQIFGAAMPEAWGWQNEVPAETHILTVDARKCYDRIPLHDAVRCSLQQGMPLSVVRPLFALYGQLIRHYSVSGFLAREPFCAMRGLPQGCPLAVWVTNAIVATWPRPIIDAGGEGHAFLDDRTVVADSAESMTRCFHAHEAWDARHSWDLNVTKTHLLSVPTRVHLPRLEHDHIHVKAVEAARCLGVQLIATYNRGAKLQNDRVNASSAVCHRIQICGMSVRCALQAISTAALTKLAYGPMATPITRARLLRMTSNVKKAAGFYRRPHAWGVVAALVNKPHRLDPWAVATYIHVTSCARGLRVHRQAQFWWRHVAHHDLPAKARGPVATLCQYLKPCGVQLQGFELTDGIFHVHLIETAWGELTHVLRHWLRQRLLSVAEATHHNLATLSVCDNEVSVKILRLPKTPNRGEIISILSDGVWSQHRKAAAGLASDDRCLFCEGREDVFHMFHECPRWEGVRSAIPPHTREYLRLAPPATSKCLHCPADASDLCKAQWPLVQTTLGHLLHTRMQEVHQPSSNEPRSDGFDCFNVPAIPVLGEGCSVYRFTLQSCLSTPQAVWPYSREEYHRLTLFMSKCVVAPKPGPEFPYCLVAEVMLSYMLLFGENRMFTGLTDVERGPLFSTQLEKFRNALLVFARLGGSVELVPPLQKHSTFVPWPRRWGLPQMQVVALRGFAPPLWARARAWLQQCSGFVAQRQLLDSRPGIEHWRHWQPGVAGSQMKERRQLPLCVTFGKQRLRTRTSSALFEQCHAARRFLASLATWPAAQQEVAPGQNLLDFLTCYGVLDRRDLRGVLAQLLQRLRRSETLNKHTDAALSNGWHVVTDTCT